MPTRPSDRPFIAAASGAYIADISARTDLANSTRALSAAAAAAASASFFATASAVCFAAVSATRFATSSALPAFAPPLPVLACSASTEGVSSTPVLSCTSSSGSSPFPARRGIAFDDAAAEHKSISRPDSAEILAL